MQRSENHKIPNLSGQVVLWSIKPVFNGSYSSVYHGRLGDQLVAVKVLKEVTGAEVSTMRRKLHRERTVWGGLRHPNVLPLYGFAEDHELFQPFGALISPWRAQGNAYEFLKAKGQSMPLYERINLWKGVVTGVDYLHTLRPALVHGDLKPANVLIDNNDIPQICDFGLVSILLDEGTSGMTTTSLHTGTDRYLAYELVLDGEKATPTMASDVFALGGIGLEFAFLQQPYAHQKNNMRGRIYADIRAGIPPARRPESPHRLNWPIWDLLGQCWERNTHERINTRDLLAEVEALTPDTSQGSGQNESEYEVTAVTLVSVTHSTVGSQATATHPVERRDSNPQRRSSATSTRGNTQQQQLQYAQQQRQSPQQPQRQPSGGGNSRVSRSGSLFTGMHPSQGNGYFQSQAPLPGSRYSFANPSAYSPPATQASQSRRDSPPPLLPPVTNTSRYSSGSSTHQRASLTPADLLSYLSSQVQAETIHSPTSSLNPPSFNSWNTPPRSSGRPYRPSPPPQNITPPTGTSFNSGAGGDPRNPLLLFRISPILPSAVSPAPRQSISPAPRPPSSSSLLARLQPPPRESALSLQPAKRNRSGSGVGSMELDPPVQQRRTGFWHPSLAPLNHEGK